MFADADESKAEGANTSSCHRVSANGGDGGDASY